MLKSMTGYGRSQNHTDARDIVAEVKSVNSRFLEQNLRISRNYSYLEEELKSLVKSKAARGKIEISITITPIEGKKADIKINEEIIKSYLDAMRNYQQKQDFSYQLEYDNANSCQMRWSSFMMLPDVFRVEKAQEDEEEIRQEVMAATEQALDAFIKMREAEGEKLTEDIRNRLLMIEKQVSIIEQEAPALTEKYRERLYTKLSELLESTAIDEQRILTEAAIFSEKTAVDEETVRLKSHISQMRKLLDSNESVGRKLDFLVQEMNREANTIGSKIQDVTITAIVVDIKSEIEKIREQIQNIE